MNLYAFFSVVDDIKAEITEDVEKHTDELKQIFVNVQSAMISCHDELAWTEGDIEDEELGTLE